MAIDMCTFETLTPSRFTTFTIPNPNSHHRLLRVAVLDSPLPQPRGPTLVAAMLVPDGRETDWIFSAESGHQQLLLSSPEISRLIILGEVPQGDLSAAYSRPKPVDAQHPRKKLEESLKPLLIALSPKSSFRENGFPEIPFLVYDDNVISSALVERCVGPRVGEMLVEDVEIDCVGSVGREFRRRLRFKRMPNLVQTEMRIVPADSSVGVGGGEFQLDMGVLVHPYLAPMVASLSVIGTCIEEFVRSGVRPRALCIGVGGGALLGFLKTQLGFEVDGVEEDEAVLKVARRYFGLEDAESIRVVVGNGIEFLEKIPKQDFCFANALNGDKIDGLDTTYDVIMVDLDGGDARNGVGAPPLGFLRKPVLLAAKMALCKLGILVLNVIPPSRSFYEVLIHEFRLVFQDLYEVDVEDEENFVLVATRSSLKAYTGTSENSFLTRLKRVIPSKYMDSIRKI